MKQDGRSEYILNILQKKNQVNVLEIAGHFNVAPMTIRRDLAFLERKGLLVKRYGGAVKTGGGERLFSFAERLGFHKVEKKAIGKRAARLASDGETIFIDCGSTPFQIAPHLIGRKNLRIITNSLPVVSEIIHDTNLRVVLIGGEIANDRRASQGPLAEKMISGFRADKAFIGADGVSTEGGLSAFNESEGVITRKMADLSREVYLVCDSSKLGKDSFYNFAPLSKLTALITDSRADRDVLSGLRKSGVTVITA